MVETIYDLCQPSMFTTTFPAKPGSSFFFRLGNLSLCNAPINVNPVAGGGVRARGGDLMPETIPAVGLLIVRSDPGVGTFDFDRQKPGIPRINSEAVTRSVPRGFLKVTLLEKGHTRRPRGR